MYDIVHTLIKRHFFQLYTETFEQKGSDIFVQRIVAKHPLLRPEFIVVNDELLGFKKAGDHIASLEKFPIFIEIEGFIEEGQRIVHTLDVYAEGQVSVQDNLTEIIFLANMYKRFLSVDRIMRVNDPSKETLMILSNVIDLFESGIYQELFFTDPYQQEQLGKAIETYFEGFTTFIQVMDDILIKGKTLKQVKHLHKPILELDHDENTD